MFAKPRLVEQIFTAVANGDLDSVESLLDRHPQLIDSRQEGKSLFHQLVRQGRFSHRIKNIFDLLIVRGLSVNNRDHVSGQTALHLAIENNSEQLIKLLLKNGADPEINDHQGQTAISLADENESSIVELLKTFCF